uniref:Uncharacterized protein n=1 Tax=Amphimedon queenslandica TaxID=400682 RepID=A0A1X7VPD8_AMPQE
MRRLCSYLWSYLVWSGYMRSRLWSMDYSIDKLYLFLIYFLLS